MIKENFLCKEYQGGIEHGASATRANSECYEVSWEVADFNNESVNVEYVAMGFLQEGW